MKTVTVYVSLSDIIGTSDNNTQLFRSDSKIQEIVTAVLSGRNASDSEELRIKLKVLADTCVQNIDWVSVKKDKATLPVSAAGVANHITKYYSYTSRFSITIEGLYCIIPRSGHSADTHPVHYIPSSNPNLRIPMLTLPDDGALFCNENNLPGRNFVKPTPLQIQEQRQHDISNALIINKTPEKLQLDDKPTDNVIETALCKRLYADYNRDRPTPGLWGLAHPRTDTRQRSIPACNKSGEPLTRLPIDQFWRQILFCAFNNKTQTNPESQRLRKVAFYFIANAAEKCGFVERTLNKATNEVDIKISLKTHRWLRELYQKHQHQQQQKKVDSEQYSEQYDRSETSPTPG